MTTAKMTALSTALLATLSLSAFAGDGAKEVDPSDMTRASSNMYVATNNHGDIKLSGALSYAYDNGQMSMVTLEGSMGNDGKYKDSRAQYFHVFSLNNAVTPRVAASLDIIDNTSFTTAAAGGVAIFRTPVDSLTFFGRAAVLGGEYSDDTTSAFGVQDNRIIGGMAAAYAVWKPGADGTYFAAYPEFTYMNGDIETSTVKTTLLAATPFSADKTRWGQFKVENTYGSMKSANQSIDIDDTVAWFQYKVFF
ncbi:hypothetical protein [Vibrio sp. VB16]|uniref:hypothetical protein n=1 Tax=Vibrio sp. VB16 TaxID=2785746 RepID=UPI0018A0B8C3|nr:hypothetical protein [Vibrio sp. VB16]UGA53603.1 hypothetical protein IUZ65_009870 [Vibrio sp. VB16]